MIEFIITDAPHQKFSVALNRRRVTLWLWYSVFADRWSIDVSIDDEPVLRGRKIVPGVDLLAAFHLGIGALFAWSDKGEAPGRRQLPQGRVKIYHTLGEEIDAAMAS